MWTQAGALLLLLACCLCSAQAQVTGGRGQNIWDEPIKFKTKGNDLCTMIVTGHLDYTRLRLSCQSRERSYWCDYVGKPVTCRNYNKNPRHYFTQMMWGLRKLHNACEAAREIKPHMCRKATDESQMVFSSASFSWSRPETQPERDQLPPRAKTTQRTSPQPTTPPAGTNAKKIAQQYCWRSLQHICAYIIGLFRN